MQRLFGAVPVAPEELDALIHELIEKEHPSKNCPCAICLVVHNAKAD